MFVTGSQTWGVFDEDEGRVDLFMPEKDGIENIIELPGAS